MQNYPNDNPKQPFFNNQRGALSAEHNPYHSPNASMEEEWEEQYHAEPFYSRYGRIGRIRFLSYSVLMILALMAASFLFGIIAAIIIPLLGDSGAFLAIIGITWLVSVIGQLYAYFMPAIRRLNDLNKTGWMSLLYLIPLVNILFWLYLVFAEGDEGENDYGIPAEPPTTLHYILALIFPIFIIAIIGILAAIALPAYQDYILRSQMGL